MPEQATLVTASGCSGGTLTLLAIALSCLPLFVIFSIDSVGWGSPIVFFGSLVLSFVPSLAVMRIRQNQLRRERSEREMQQKQLDAEYQEKLKVWQHLKQQWNRAYYCRRCDVVYLDGGQQYTSPDNMLKLLARAR
jgi:hypothetical protein